MKHNLMKKIANDLSSGKRRKTGGRILCGLGAVIAFGMACTLLLSAGAVDSRDREAAAPGSVAIDHSYETEVNGFAVTVHVEGVGSCRPADEAGPEVPELPGGNDPAACAEGERQILLASLQDPVVPQPEPQEENGAGTDEESADEQTPKDGTETDELSAGETESGTGSREPQIECHVEKVTEGEGYEAMIAQLAEEVDETDAPTQVMELTASVDGTKLDLSGCQITVQAVPTRELMEAVGDGGTPGMMSMTVLPLGGEPVEQLFTSGEMENSDSLPAVKATYTVPDDTPVVYAVRSRSIDHLVLQEDTTWEYWMDAGDDKGTMVDMVIDLNGNTLSVDRSNAPAWGVRAPLFYVHHGSSLTIMDSAGNGSINVSGLESIVTTINDNPGLGESVVNIKGGLLRNADGEHVILVNDKGTVNISDGTITGAKTGGEGGGIWAKSGVVNITGGVISNNTAMYYGGGVYADRVEISGGLISGNQVTSGTCQGGGVWANQLIMNGGEISGNTSYHAGGGVYTKSMLMTDGVIAGNKVLTGSSGLQGGGGIYIDRRDETMDPILVDGSIKYNMSITGGTIRDNESDHTGGGIYVNTGAVAHIRGMNGGIVHIKGNKALDKTYEYGKNTGHGFAGGGIFVEHPNNTGSATEGGFVYIYNAVVTDNTAQHGGGVAGCGSSSVEICSVDGVAVYGNHVNPSGNAAENSYYKASVDLYADGSGKVDSMMMGGVQAAWRGRAAGTDDEVYFNQGVKEFKGGFYLTAEGLTEKAKGDIYDCATVYIEGNYSKSGGGGVGGNGFIKLGLKAPDNDKYSLELRKRVSSLEEGSISEKFEFTITLTNSVGPLSGSLSYRRGKITAEEADGEQRTEETVDQLTFDGSGSCKLELGDKEYIIIEGLLPGTQYHITETPVPGYKLPDIEGSGAIRFDDSRYGVSGAIGTDNQVVFTNMISYALPSTGGMTPALYYLLGCAMLAVTAGLIQKRRMRKEGCCR